MRIIHGARWPFAAVYHRKALKEMSVFLGTDLWHVTAVLRGGQCILADWGEKQVRLVFTTHQDMVLLQQHFRCPFWNSFWWKFCVSSVVGALNVMPGTLHWPGLIVDSWHWSSYWLRCYLYYKFTSYPPVRLHIQNYKVGSLTQWISRLLAWPMFLRLHKLRVHRQTYSICACVTTVSLFQPAPLGLTVPD